MGKDLLRWNGYLGCMVDDKLVKKLYSNVANDTKRKDEQQKSLTVATSEMLRTRGILFKHARGMNIDFVQWRP